MLSVIDQELDFVDKRTDFIVTISSGVVFALTLSIALLVIIPARAQTMYSPDQYPTAQGQYLQLPNSYRQQAATSPSPPSSSLTSPRYVAATPPPAPIAPKPVAYAPSSIDIQPMQVPPVYPQTSRIPAASTPAPASVPAQPAAPTSYSNMLSYTYNPKLDPAHPPYKTPLAHDTKAIGSSGIGLGTITGYEIGIEVSDYRYQEFDPSGARLIRITGPTVAVLLDGSKLYSSGWFITGDLRISYGLHNYTGGDIITSGPDTGDILPSTHDGIDDWMFDIRALGGHDFLLRDSFWGLTDIDLSPYAGLGFRFLYDDSRGDDSNGVEGYERYSHYLYLPIGFTPRFRLTENSRLSVNMEYDLLLYGWQVSSLSDADPGETDVTDTQKTGYGLRGSVMYERPVWSAGPFFEFWDIGQSTTDCNNAGCGFEPHNQTFEFGVEGRYRF